MLYRDIETPRLRLRGMAREDAAFLFRQFSDPRVTRWLKDAEPYTRPEEADELIAFYTVPEPRAQHRWMLTSKLSGETLGTCGFHRVDTRTRSAEVGYDLWLDYAGMGYMTEALRAALAFAARDMGMERVIAHIHPDNARSVAMARRLGFERMPERVEYTFRGVVILHDVYALRLAPD